jgi:lipopolysaccharide/colanic/teichoic acid biosynthesis glycosyltransferase
MRKDSTRMFDIVIATAGLLCLSPLFAGIAVLIKLTSKGPVFFFQYRVGIYNEDFRLYKFRTMYLNADKERTLTIGMHDNRITSTGAFLRRYKLDELPQLWNVLKGEMSLVGPRPELRKYVELYSIHQKEVLKVRPGITDTASIQFRNESELLANAPDPEQFYMQHILPAKLKLNQYYIINKSPKLYFKVIFTTIYSVWKQ